MFRFKEVFNCFPQQEIVATDICIGDIVCVRNEWIVVYNTKLDPNMNNNNHNLCIDSVCGSVSYVTPNEKLNIISRNLIDKNKLQTIMNKYKEEIKQYYDECNSDEEYYHR